MALSDITPIKRSEEYLQRIADAIENGGGGGSDLPAVTSADNGDVLTVVNGAWDKAEPASQLPAVTSSNNGNVLTVVDGVWDKAAPSGGGHPLLTVSDTETTVSVGGVDYSAYAVSGGTYHSVTDAISDGIPVLLLDTGKGIDVLMVNSYSDNDAEYTGFPYSVSVTGFSCYAATASGTLYVIDAPK